jgi:Na+-driven multidrug efflux pump
MFLAISLRTFFIGITQTKVIIYVTLLSAATNVFFDYCFIFGNLGFPVLGIKGAGYASVIAETVMFFGYFFISIFWKALKKYQLFSMNVRKFRIQIITKIFMVGLPLMIQNWVSFSSWLLFFLFIEKIGTTALAISTILKTIYLLYLIPVYGFAAAANTMISNMIGSNKINRVPYYIQKITFIATIFILIPLSIPTFFPEFMLSLFTNSPTIIEAGVAPLRVLCFALLLFPASIVMFHAISGTGDTKAAMVIEIITIACYVGYIIVSAYILQWAITYIWMAEIVYMSIMGFGAFYWIRSNKWRKATV